MPRSLHKLQYALHRLRGGSIARDLDPYLPLLAEINRRKDELKQATDPALIRISEDLRDRTRTGVPLNDLLTEGFALVCEAARRSLGMDAFDVQIIGGMALHQGKLAEMQTGEGKTLAAVFPAYLNALTGRGVHVLTFNDYLARRDAEWMAPVYRLLGLSVGVIQEGMSREDRQRAYRSDITYATAKEAGFDFLRDRLCRDEKDLVHRPFHLAIVDEADSILIDEARVPLVVAGATGGPEISPYRMAEIAGDLDQGIDFETDEYARNVYMTESGLDRVEAGLGCGNLHAPENLPLLTDLNCALHAQVLPHRDVDYIVRDEKIEIVDEFTGRVAKDRYWPDGLQAAIEAKEGLPIHPQGTILGSIALQHFVRSYPTVCGMTATAQPAAEEFNEFYGLRIVVIPPNRPCIRTDHPDVVFTHKAAKHRALVEEVARVHAMGRPILVGTSSVEESDHLALTLREAGIACDVLNAKKDEKEAGIIAQAGSLGAVTISTNMAGRGTDIRLGGEQGQKREEVVALGGLYVIGTNRHESLRVDNQLRGRAGRQGDPGASRFFISLEDYLIKRYGIDALIPPRYRPQKGNDPIDNPVVRREIARAQRIVEGQNFEIRKTLWRYSSLIEQQRKPVHQWREDVLLGQESPHPFEIHAPERYLALRETVDDAVLKNVEKQITLAVTDQCWCEYLAQIAHIREGIHLVSVSGQNALEEFHKLANRAFEELRDRIGGEIARTFASVEVTAGGVDLEKEGLQAPASTWTYLVNDNTFGNKLEMLLVGNRNIGFAAVAAFMWGPLLFGIAAYRRLRRIFWK